jgi:hypothetical protein
MRDGSEPVRGAVVSLYDGRGLLEQHKTDFTGRCVFSGLEPADYTVRETSVPYYALPSRAVHRVGGADCPRFREVGFASAPRFAPVGEGVDSAAVRARINELRAKASVRG